VRHVFSQVFSDPAAYDLPKAALIPFDFHHHRTNLAIIRRGHIWMPVCTGLVLPTSLPGWLAVSAGGINPSAR
jgi:hypothetical protein